MLKLITLAFRNLLRNKRRSIITLAAISMGLAIMLFGQSLQYGSYKDMINSGVSQVAGHVVVQHKDFQAEKAVEKFFLDASTIANTLQKTAPEATLTQRILLQGLITSPNSPSPAMINAIDPIAEKEVSSFDEKMIDGEWLTGAENEILIGEGMAKTLNAKLGDKLVATVQVIEGDPNTHMFRVKGIFKTGSNDIDSFFCYVHYKAGQALLKPNDQENAPDVLHQLAVHIEDVDAAESLKSDIINALGPAQITKQELAVLSWREAIPDLLTMIALDKKSNGFIHLIMGLIVAMGILNTILMSVLERTRELGVLLAIGMKAKKLSIMVLLEGLILGIMGAMMGLLLGYLFSYPVVANGLDLSAQMGEAMDMGGYVTSTVIYGAYNWSAMLTYALLAVLFSVFSAAYPAWRITRFDPVTAMRHH